MEEGVLSNEAGRLGKELPRRKTCSVQRGVSCTYAARI